MIRCQGVEKVFLAQNEQPPLHWRVPQLTVSRGERVLVTGPSGCGKTTLLNLLAGLLRPDAGEIEVDGERLDQLGTAEADVFRGRHLGLIFQSFQLLAPLTVMENLLLAARYGRKWDVYTAHEKAEQLLDEVGLRERRHYFPAVLSIGEQQRVAIARALINEPPLLLADEPTASLDARNSTIVLDLLFRLSERHGATLVAVSHDTGIVTRFDRLISAAEWMTEESAEVAHV